MKTVFRSVFGVIAILLFSVVNQALAQRWLGTVDNNWATAANWEGDVKPGTADTAVFDGDGGGNTNIMYTGTSPQVLGIEFSSSACAPYSIGSSAAQLIVLSRDGYITIDESVPHDQIFNCGIKLGNTTYLHTITLRNYSLFSTLRVLGDFEYRSDTTRYSFLQFEGVGDMVFDNNLTTNGLARGFVRNLNTGTITIGGQWLVTRWYNFDGKAAGEGDTHLMLREGAELFLSNLDSNYSIWHEGKGVIDGSGTLRFGVGLTGGSATIYVKTGSELTIRAPLTSAGGLDHYNESSGGGTLVLDCVNTMASNMVVSGFGILSVAKIGNQGSTTSNLGQGDKIIFTGDPVRERTATMVYTGEGETTDRIIDFSKHLVLDQSGSGDLIFSEDLIFSADVARLLTLTGSTSASGELAGAIGAPDNLAALTKDGSGEWRLSGANAYSGITTIKDGTLTLCGANGAIAATASINLSGGTLRISNTADANHLDRVNDSAPITMQGGLIDFAHDGAVGVDYSETLGALTVADQTIGEIRVSSAAEGASSTLTFASVTVAGNGTVNFVGEGLGDEGNTTNRIFFSTPPTLVNGVLPWAVVNGTSMATYDVNRGVYASSVSIAARGPDSVIPDSDAANVEINSAGVEGPITLGSLEGASISTLTQSSDTPAVVAMNNQTLQVRKVTVNEDAASLTLGESVAEGGILHIASGSVGMGLVNNSTNALSVNSELFESIPGAGISKSGKGAVNLNGKVSAVGDLLVSDGILTLGALTNGTHLIGSFFEMRGGAQTPAELRLYGSAEVANNGNLSTCVDAGDRCIVTITNDLTIQATAENEGGRLYVGNGMDTAGVIIQNSGVLRVSTGLRSTAFYQLGIGGGYGYHRLNGGELTTGEMTIGASSWGGGDGNSSVFDMFGGELNLDGWCLLISWGKGEGVLNVFGGSIASINNLGAQAMLLTYNTGLGSTAQVNLLGPNARIFDRGPALKKRIDMARGHNNALVALNLNDGELTLYEAYTYTNTTPSHFNFNGGLLKAADSSMMMDGLTAAHVFSGNARIDTDGFDASINQPLVAPHGYGAVSIELLSGGSDYIGAPSVVLQGGSGIGATAIALVDLEKSSSTCGQITNIMVTAAGVGYAETDTLTAVLRGGGCLTPATVGAVSLAPNVSGGLIKQGAGTLTLNGACTYTGGTLVTEGTLKFGRSDALLPGSTVTLEDNTMLDLNGFTVTNAVDGGGTFINGTLYGEFSPAGVGVLGTQTLTPGDNAALEGSYILDVTENGDCDQLVIGGDVDISALQLQVVDLEKLSRRKSYAIAVISDGAQGLFAPGNLPNEKWIIKRAEGVVWLLYSDGLQLIIR